MTPLKTRVAPNPENRRKMEELCRDLREKLQASTFQGEEKYIRRNEERGKLLARERVELLLDKDSPFLELMPLVGLGQKDASLGASIVAGLGVVEGVLTLINANVHTLKGGALNSWSVRKAARLDDIALENRLPMIYLNESAGADLPQQAEIFNQGGRAFREITRRSALGIPSITAVFGSSTAGGAYIPGMSDHVVMVKDRARAYLAGPPLVKMAINEDVGDEELGGAQMHAQRSGLCDYLAEDEKDALRLVREILALYKEEEPVPKRAFQEPLYSSEDLLSLVSADVKVPFEMKEVIARLVDGSRFLEFKKDYGKTLVCGWANIFGRKVGIIGNNGVLFSDSANKGAHFIQLCDRLKTPLVFLQNITGFMVGRSAEQEGIIKNGAKLVNAVSNAKVPAITIMTGSSYGAGNYGMCGRAYAPRFLFSWPNSKLAVMGPEQLTGVMEIIQKQKEAKNSGLNPGKFIDKAKGKLIKDSLKKRIEEESSAYYGTSRLWDDGIIDPRDTRTVLGMTLEVVFRNISADEPRYGVYRM